MSKTEIRDVAFIDCDSGSEIDVGVAGQKIGVYAPVKNISGSGYIILLHAQLFKNGTLIEANLIHSELYLNGGETKEWYSEFYMPDGDALVTVHSYVWPDYPPSSPDYTTMGTLPLGVGWVRVDREIASISPALVVEDWIKADSQFATVQPGAVGWIKVDSQFATIQPGLVGWIKADSKTAVVNPTGVPVCVPGETKCVDYDLYTCSLASQWKLTERNAVKCGYVPEEKPPKAFPWLWIGAGVAAASLVGLVVVGEEKK